jgi:signal transduction histidine kinase
MVPPPHDPAPPPDTRLLDGLASHIALLDRHGRIAWTNTAWNRFGAENGADAAHGVGSIYRRVCERAAEYAVNNATDPETADRDARAMTGLAASLDAVARGDLGHHIQAYDCSSPEINRVFQAQVSAFELDGQRYTLVSHDDITGSVDGAQRVVRLASLERVTNPATVAGSAAEMIGHELNNPVTALICTLAGARRLLENGPPELGHHGELHEAIANAISHADQARAVLAALRSIAPVHRVSEDVTDLARLAEAVIQSVTEENRLTAVRIERDLKPARTRTDPTHAALVLLALLRDAARVACDQPLAERVIRVTTRSTSGQAQIVIARPGTDATPGTPNPTDAEDRFGLRFARHTVATLGGTLRHDSEGTVLSLPATGRAAA